MHKLTEFLQVKPAGLVGAVTGLKSFLLFFKPRHASGTEFIHRLYKYTKFLSQPPDPTTKSHQLHHCAMDLLKIHSSFFAKLFFADFDYWHRILLCEWQKFPPNDQKSAFLLAEAIHGEIDKEIMNGNQDEVEIKRITDQLSQHFSRAIKSTVNLRYNEIRLALRGYESLAKSFDKIFGRNFIAEFLSVIIQRSEYFMNNPCDKNNVELMAIFARTIMHLYFFVPELSGTGADTVSNLNVCLIRYSYLLPQEKHSPVAEDVLNALSNLLRINDTILEDVILRLMHESVIWICSHKLTIEADNDWSETSDWKEQITYKSFLPFWRCLMQTSDDEDEDDAPEKAIISKKLFDKFIETLFTLLDKLDLSTSNRSDGDPSDQMPKNPNDFHVFINLVEFYNSFLYSQKYFGEWLSQFTEKIIIKSIRFPLVSGFFKLMTTALRFCSLQNVFEGCDPNDAIFVRIRQFVSGAAAKTSQCWGELQLTCIKMLCWTPTEVLNETISSFEKVVRIGVEIFLKIEDFELGNGIVSLIERYIRGQDRKSTNLETFLRQILPQIRKMLTSKSNPQKNLQNRSNRNRAKKIQVIETKSKALRKRVVKMLGTIEPFACKFLVDSANETTQLRSLKKNQIEIKLFDSSGKHLMISLDDLIPRACDLTLTASDRQQKISACEFVHAIILYAVDSYEFDLNLWQTLCRNLLRLSCDSDGIVQQLFEPLLMQIAHYLSRPQASGQKRTKTFFDCLIETLSAGDNVLEQHLAARCLREIVTWAIKLSTPEQLTGTPFDVRSIIEHIQMLSTQTNQTKRIGAAIAFNNLYSILCDNDAIVSEFWIELLHTFCLNFELSENHCETNVYVQHNLTHLSLALDNIFRIFREKHQIFNEIDIKRRFPAKFGHGNFEAVIHWTLMQCTSISKIYQKEIMEKCLPLCSIVDGNSIAKFLLEIQCLAEEELRSDAAYAEKITAIGPSHYVRWLRRLNATIDFYRWLLDSKLIARPDEFFKSSNIFTSLRLFVEQASIGITVNRERDNIQPSLELKEQIESLKRSVLLQILELFTKLLELDEQTFSPDFWQNTTHSLIGLLMQLAFQRSQLSFSASQIETHSILTRCLTSFIEAGFRHGSSSFRNELQCQLQTKFVIEYEYIIDTLRAVLRSESTLLAEFDAANGLELIYRLQKEKQIVILNQELSIVDIFTSKLLHEIFDTISAIFSSTTSDKTISVNAKRYAKRLLQICLIDNTITKKIVNLLLNSTDVSFRSRDETRIETKLGKRFYELFKITFCRHFTRNPHFFDELFLCLSLNNFRFIVGLVKNCLEFVYKNQTSETMDCRRQTVDVLINHTSKLLDVESQWNKGTTKKLMMNFLIHLTSVARTVSKEQVHQIGNRVTNLKQWIVDVNKAQSVAQLDVQVKSVALLPCFAGSDISIDPEIKSILNSFESKVFSLNASRCIERNTMKNGVQILIDAMCTAPSLLQFVIRIGVEMNRTVDENQISDGLTKLVTFSSEDEQFNHMNDVFNLFVTCSVDATIRLLILRRFLLKLIRFSSPCATERFFIARIKDIMDLNVNEDFSSSANTYEFEQSVASGIAGFEMCEAMSLFHQANEESDSMTRIGQELFGEFA